MSKKVKSAKKAKAKGEVGKVIPGHQPEQKNIEQEDNETPFDFGGLPKCDLKKNLGCG